jgi:SNF2 family DNA or RNA helicase
MRQSKKIELTVSGNFISVPKCHRMLVHRFSPFLEGSRRWLQDGSFRFEATPINIRKCEEVGFSVEVEKEGSGSIWDEEWSKRPEFKSPLKNMEHQERASDKFKDKHVCAIFAEMGTGKTKMAIDRVNREWCSGKIDAAIVLAKKGVHVQWAEGELDEDGNKKPSPIESLTQDSITHREFAWKGKPFPKEAFQKFDGLTWMTFNFDAIIHKKAASEVEKFLKAYEGRVAFVGDETHYLKSYRAARTKAAIKVSEQCELRIIMTGTPLAKNLEDEWSQFKVLDESIIGHRYVTTFRNDFCIMGGFEGREVVGTRNLDRFKELTEPYVFRVTKSECLDLPEKQYRQLKFKLSQEQSQAIAQLRQTQTFTLPNGEDLFFEGAAPTLGKIQEVSNGFLLHPEGIHLFGKNPRVEALNEFLEENPEKAIIWCRYKYDVKVLMDQFGEAAVDYYGETKDKDRILNKAAFINEDKIRYLVATPAAAGEGLDGLQKACSLAVYYSNSFSSLSRWQSEDRIHRIGMGDKAVFVDMIARGCIDYSVLRNLREKKDFSSLVLDVGREFGISSHTVGKYTPGSDECVIDSQPYTTEEKLSLEADFETTKLNWE